MSKGETPTLKAKVSIFLAEPTQAWRYIEKGYRI